MGGVRVVSNMIPNDLILELIARIFQNSSSIKYKGLKNRKLIYCAYLRLAEPLLTVVCGKLRSKATELPPSLDNTTSNLFV